MKTNEEILDLLVNRVYEMMSDLAGKKLGDDLRDSSIHALATLLIQKGIISKEEFDQEMRAQIKNGIELRQEIKDMLQADVNTSN